ncbi:hypothetical protein MNBD_PLANCTO02-1279, partial [hydrothermal vent metagenome]
FGRNKQMAWMMWHASKDRKLPPISKVLEGVPVGLQNVIDRLCQKDQSQRYDSAREVLNDLAENPEAGSSKRTSLVTQKKEEEESKPKNDPRKKRLLLAGGALLVSLVMSIAMIFTPEGGGGPGRVRGLQKVGIVRKILINQHKIVLVNSKTGIPVEIYIGEKPRLFLRNKQKYILLKDLQKGDRIQFKTLKVSTNVKGIELIVSRPAESSGKIEKIDYGISQLIVSIQKGEVRGDVPLQVLKTSQFQLNNNNASLKELKVGDRVTIKHLEKLDGSGQLLQSLFALRLVEAIGDISEIDLKQKELTINRPNRQLNEMISLSLSNRCIIKRAGKTIQLKNIKVADRIRFQYDSAIHSITVAPGKKLLKSYIVAINEAKKQLTIRSVSGADNHLYSLNKNCDMTLGQKPASLKDLRLSDRVTVSYNPSKKEQTPRQLFSLDAVRGEKYDRAAIIIGTADFTDSYLTPLPHTENDLSLMYDIMLDRYAIAKKNLLDLRGAKKASILNQLKPWLKNVKTHTQLIVYVSGHAYTNSEGNTFLAPFDFKYDKIEETGVSLDWLVQTVQSSISENKMLLLDCTHAGSGADLGKEYSAEEMFQKISPLANSLYLIGSTQKGERGMLTANRQHGLFARIAADALGGAADSNKDLQISTLDLFNFIQKKMKRFESKAGQKQTPILVKPH